MRALGALARFSASLGLVSASTIPSGLQLEARSVLHARATVNGSCISAPDDATTSLVGLCVGKIASGRTRPNAMWTDPLCVAAATGSSMGAVLDAACCAGTCTKPVNTGNLDVSKVYRAMVGSGCTATTASSCALTWQPFVDFIYSTIQASGTQIWPDSGDVILDRWEEIATWTGFCKGTSCADGAIPYSNLNDWFHFSSDVTQTTPGTPQFAYVFPTLDENLDNTTPNIFWPCLYDDPTFCSWDWAPPDLGAFDSDFTLQPAVVRAPSPTVNSAAAITALASPTSGTEHLTEPHPGRVSFPPPNLPPPVYANGELVPLILNGTPVVWNVTTRRAAPESLPDTLHKVPPILAELPHGNVSLPKGVVERAIVRDACRKPTNIPTMLPTLTYYCDKLPQICANIRSHPDWDATTNTMELTYDPWDGGRRRGKVCKQSVTKAMQEEGKCDPKQHASYHWKVSCDEFPFSSSLEGGAGNAVVMAVSHYEQDLQSTLQSSITHLRTKQRDKRTAWKTTSACHRYRLKLVNSTPVGSSPSAIGFLDAGSNFFAKAGLKSRELKNVNVLRSPPPPEFAAVTDYPPTANALTMKGSKLPIDCTPCDSDSDSDSDSVSELESAFGDMRLEASDAPAPTSPPSRGSPLVQPLASSCTVRPTAAPLPTTSAQASAIAADSAKAAKAAAAAAAAALAAASNPAPEFHAAAAAAVSAASDLAPAAAALASAGTDSALAAAIASAQSVTSSAQNTLDNILSFGPSVPSWFSDVFHHIAPAASSVSTATASSANVLNPATVIPPVVDPDHDPIIVSPPVGVPPAACFGAGSHGFVKRNGLTLANSNGPVGAELVDAGSDAYFGLTLGENRALAEVSGCHGVYEWATDVGLAPNFQVDCSTMELGAYWNGVKQTCYASVVSRDTKTGLEVFALMCGASVANIYACMQAQGLYGDVEPSFMTWSTSAK